MVLDPAESEIKFCAIVSKIVNVKIQIYYLDLHSNVCQGTNELSFFFFFFFLVNQLSRPKPKV